jgi:tripartite-type tricarboxylate transporter receptor subunit TctC
MLRPAIFIASGVLLTGAGGSAALAQDYPVKPIRFLTGGLGGTNDIVSRAVAQGLTAEVVAKAAPDGYTVVVIGSSFWTLPLLQKVSYDPVKNFAPITIAVRAPSILAVHPSVPAKSVKELIALAKAKPGSLAYASTSVGGPLHIAGEMFKSMAGVDILNVPYKSLGTAITDTVSAQVQVIFATAIALAPQLEPGRLRALAVTSNQPSPLTPGLPTVSATGLPGFELTSPQALFVPAGTPASIIVRLNQETVRILNQPANREMFARAGVEVVGSSPEELGAYVKADMAKLARLIKVAGIRVE